MASHVPLLANQSSLSVKISGYFVADSNGRFNYPHNLISITNGIIYFNGVTKFTGNEAVEIIHASLLSFSNITVFVKNVCYQLICKTCYLAFVRPYDWV